MVFWPFTSSKRLNNVLIKKKMTKLKTIQTILYLLNFVLSSFSVAYVTLTDRYRLRWLMKSYHILEKAIRQKWKLVLRDQEIDSWFRNREPLIPILLNFFHHSLNNIQYFNSPLNYLFIFCPSCWTRSYWKSFT